MEGAEFSLQVLHLTMDSANPQRGRNIERKLFEAIKKGDLEKVRNTVSLSQPKCDLNRVNNFGQTVLQVAGELEDVFVRNGMMDMLLSAGADFEFALLQAVRQGNEKSVEILLKFQRIPSTKPFSVKEPIGIRRQRYVTPLILAAALQHFKIVKLLLKHGFTISDYQTDSEEPFFSNGEVSEKLGPAVFRLNRYRALASPVYMAASFLQNSLSGAVPVHVACALGKELCNMAEQEYEFRKEYLELSEGCKEFAVSLLNECQSMKEIRCVMEMQSEETNRPTNTDGAFLNTLEFAIATKNGKFVCHPYSQLVLNLEVYRDVHFLEKSSWKQFAMMMASVLLPFIFLVWLIFETFLPTHNIARMFHSPCMKFLVHCGSYQMFLIVFVWSTFQQSQSFLEYAYIDWVVFLFVFGQLVDIIKEVYQQGRARFFSNNWNYLALATVTSLLVYYVLWWAGRVALMGKLDSMTWENHANSRAYTIVLVSDVFLAVAILLAFVQNFSFVQANATIGPLLQAFIQMLIDVMKFFFYFVFVFFAFAVSFLKLYSQYENARQHFLSSPTETNKTAGLLPLERFSRNIFATFWSLFGQTERETFKGDEKEYEAIWQTGVTLFAVFNIVAVLVGLNMLIAILNDSYTRITANLDTEWKVTRTKLWLSWVYKKSVLPPPFNLLYLLLPFIWVIKRLAESCCTKRALKCFENLVKRKKLKSAWKARKIDEKERREVIRHLVLRNLAKTSCYVESGSESSDSDEERDKEAAVSLANNGCQTNRPETTAL